MTPDCMAPEELTLWRQSTKATVPCIDCPVWFAADMRAKGCCNGNPHETGRPRQSFDMRLLGRGGPGRGYETDEQRRNARRQTWRAFAERRRRARMEYGRNG